mmetsp:Transcript_14772/g.55680  ORF Transcript_14772/g.55680 Transcript_14772/m.55680 type:complete len:91 (+) Transcript_14772:967-1239(+)
MVLAGAPSPAAAGGSEGFSPAFSGTRLAFDSGRPAAPRADGPPRSLAAVRLGRAGAVTLRDSALAMPREVARMLRSAQAASRRGLRCCFF